MKINKIALIALAVCLQLQGVAPETLSKKSKSSSINRLYKQVKDDIKIIKKCYLSSSPACSQQERTEARNASLRLSGETIALIAAIGSLSYVGYRAYNWRNKDAQKKDDKSNAGST